MRKVLYRIVWHLGGGDGGLVPPLTENEKYEIKKVVLVKNSSFWAPLTH